MLLSARGRIPTHAERTLSAYTISKVTWRDGAPCFRGHGASVAASRGKSSCLCDGAGRGEVLILVLALGLLVELELARAATHFFYLESTYAVTNAICMPLRGVSVLD